MDVEIELKHGIKKKYNSVRSIDDINGIIYITYPSTIDRSYINYSINLGHIKEIKIYGDK